MSARRYRDLERLQAAARKQIPAAALAWLAAARAPLEELTTAALSGQVSDADFREMVERFAAKLPELFDQLDHNALATLMETTMGAAMANGIAERHKTSRLKTQDRKAKLPWEEEAWLAAGGKGKPCGNSWIPRWKRCVVNMGSSQWQGSAKEMHARARATMQNTPTLKHPESGVEMIVTADGILKSLHTMRRPEEFMAAAEIIRIFLDSTKAGPGEPDRKKRPEIKAFHRFETEIGFGRARMTAEIITKELVGDPVHRLKQIRLK